MIIRKLLANTATRRITFVGLATLASSCTSLLRRQSRSKLAEKMPIYSMMSNSRAIILEELDMFGSTLRPPAVMVVAAGCDPACKL